MADAVPAVVVSGFLGSGKTTLVRNLLEDAQRNGVRVAVVSNEFGELGIDQALLGESGEAYVEIEGGCVCCKLSDELVATLQTVWERVRPDRIIVETSGVALPYDTQLNFGREPIASWVGDDVAIVVVNAEQLHAGRELEGTFEDQVSSADLLLLNKIDLIPEAALAALEERLAEWAPGTPVLRSVQAEIDPAVLFAPGVRELARERAPTPHEHESFTAEQIEIAEGVHPEALEAQLAAEGALRIKGFVQTSSGLRLVQGVGPRIELLPVDTPPPADLINRLILIRRGA